MPPRKKVVEDSKTCAQCEFYTEKMGPNTRENGGWCLRYPPLIIVHEDQISTTHHVTEPEWWCGEFKRKLQS